ncbi:MAG: diguanylate cyclase [Piscirickettsiaceae bacterium]|nr:diguanylate cyclase [Piscirickettsiaceae bacterium]
MSYLDLSPKKKITIPALLYIFWVVCFTYFNVASEKEELYQTLNQQLQNATLITELLVPDTLHHQGMQAKDLTWEQDYNNTLQLSSFTDSQDIVYIYTLILRNDKIFFTSSSSTIEEREANKELVSYFEHYEDVDPRVFDIFDSKEQAFLEYTDQWGTFRSLFIPSYSSDGTFYLIAADLPIEHIKTLLNQKIYHSLIIAILFLIFVYPIYLTATLKIKNIAKELDKKVQLQTSELVQNEKHLNHALTTANQSWFDANLITEEIDVSAGLPKLLKYDPSRFKINLQVWKNNIHRDDKDSVLALFEECLKTGETINAEYRLHARDGSWVWLHSVAEVIEWDEKNNPIRMVGIHRNITKRKRSEDVLRTLAETGITQDGDIFKTIVHQLALSHDVRYVFIGCVNPLDRTQIDTIAVWANGEFGQNFSYSLVGTPCSNIIYENDISFYPNHIQQQFPDDHMLVQMGAESYIGVPLKNSTGKVLGLIAMLDDKPMLAPDHLSTLVLLKSLAVRANIELERKASKERLEMMAHYDVLTQLPNRTLFADRFKQAVAHSKRTDSLLAICFLDLDNFKPVNDSYGHEVGDQLLIEVAARLIATIREEDTASRQGGDEFALLLRDIESFDQCEQLLERIRHTLAQPYLINGYPHKISVSIGVTIYPHDDADLDTLLRHADQAMYQAKLTGKDQQQLFNTITDQ